MATATFWMVPKRCPAVMVTQSLRQVDLVVVFVRIDTVTG